MKKSLLFLFLLIGITLSAQNIKREIIPLNELQTAATHFAQERWVNVDAAEPIPYYSPDGNIIAYGFNFAIDKEFPEDGNPTFSNELDEDGNSSIQAPLSPTS